MEIICIITCSIAAARRRPPPASVVYELEDGLWWRTRAGVAGPFKLQDL